MVQPARPPIPLIASGLGLCSAEGAWTLQTTIPRLLCVPQPMGGAGGRGARGRRRGTIFWVPAEVSSLQQPPAAFSLLPPLLLPAHFHIPQWFQ